MLRAKQTDSAISEPMDGLGTPSSAGRDQVRPSDASRLQQAILEIAFGGGAPEALAQRLLEILQGVFTECAVVLSLAQEGSPLLVHKSQKGLTRLLQRSAGVSPAAVAYAAGKSICAADLARDARFPRHNKLAQDKNWQACCAEPCCPHRAPGSAPCLCISRPSGRSPGAGD